MDPETEAMPLRQRILCKGPGSELGGGSRIGVGPCSPAHHEGPCSPGVVLRVDRDGSVIGPAGPGSNLIDFVEGGSGQGSGSGHSGHSHHHNGHGHGHGHRNGRHVERVDHDHHSYVGHGGGERRGRSCSRATDRSNVSHVPEMQNITKDYRNYRERERIRSEERMRERDMREEREMRRGGGDRRPPPPIRTTSVGMGGGVSTTPLPWINPEDSASVVSSIPSPRINLSYPWG